MYKVAVKLPCAPGKVGTQCLGNISRRNLGMLTHSDCRHYPCQLGFILPLCKAQNSSAHSTCSCQPPCKPAIPSLCPHYQVLHPHFPISQNLSYDLLHTETPLGTHSCFKPLLLSIFSPTTSTLSRLSCPGSQKTKTELIKLNIPSCK